MLWVMPYFPPSSGAAAATTRTVLASDVTTSSTSYVDLPGLGVPVTNGVLSSFRFVLFLSSSSDANGSNVSLNGPAAALLAYKALLPSGDTTVLSSNRTSYNAGQGSANMPTGGEAVAVIEGFLLPSASGTLIARFLSELGGADSITVKAGSYVDYA